MRALRRHHRQRLKNNRKHNQGNRLERNYIESVLSFWIDTPKGCSCWMCGNQRKYFGTPTVQEQRFLCIKIEEDWGA